jgi:DNA-binding IclR family transcriptional regulator
VSVRHIVGTNTLRPADREILRYLAENPPEYVPLMATRLGLPLGHANERTASLVDRGLVEPVTNECIYRLTAAGEQRLQEATADAETASEVADD